MRRFSVTASLLSLLTGLFLMLGTSPSPATFPGQNGLIAFNRGGNVFTFNPTTKVSKQITTGGGYSGARWSPDGKQLAYKNTAGAIFVRTMATGRTVRVVTGADASAGGPMWSGDGTRVAYIATLPDPNNEHCGEQGIYSVPKSGGTPTLVFSTFVEGWEYCAFSPTLSLGNWSPDNRTILLTTCSAGAGGTGCDLGAVDVAGGQAGKPSFHTVFDIGCDLDDVEYQPGDGGTCLWPHVSGGSYGPGGRGILFSAYGGYNHHSPFYPPDLPYWDSTERIYSISSSGTSLHQVSVSPVGYNPTSAPNGGPVLFTKRSGTTTNIVKASSSGVNATVTVLIRNASQADWQPVP